MQLVFLFGPQAVGKMTIGQELERLTGYKLFHNHLAIELVAPFFSYGTTEGRGLVSRIRQEFFTAFAESRAPGYILTFVWQFDAPGEADYMNDIATIFKRTGYEVYWIELEATLQERLRRNRTENRLTHKPSKRNLEWSQAKLLESNENHRLNSEDGEFTSPNYLRIDTTHLSVEQTANKIWGFLRRPD